MVEPVVKLLNGRGHRIVRARDVGIEAEDDQILVEYALARNLVIVTFDRDLRDKVLRGRCRCLHVRPPERTARQRLADAYDEIVQLFSVGRYELVTLAREGRVDGERPNPDVREASRAS
jgi:predicted nuclease of predicted toxin-antitoxin system